MPTKKRTKSDALKKKQLIEALESSLGVVTPACKRVGIARSTFYEWLKKDADFANAVQEIESVSLDFAESHLHKQIKDGNTAATIFYLKTKGKKRGYIERQEISGPGGDPIGVEITRPDLSWED